MDGEKHAQLGVVAAEEAGRGVAGDLPRLHRLQETGALLAQARQLQRHLQLVAVGAAGPRMNSLQQTGRHLAKPDYDLDELPL